MYCKECGSENDNGAKYCQNCGSPLIEENKKDDKNRIDSMWLVVAILLPIVGIFGGLYYAWKGKEGAWAVVGLSIFVWFIFFLLIMSF